MILARHMRKQGLRKYFSEMIPKQSTGSVSPLKPFDIQLEVSKTTLSLSPEEFLSAKNSGSDLYLTPEKLNEVSKTGFFFEDANEKIDLEAVAYKGWRLQYLKNMLLLQDYNNIFRDFLQSCANGNMNGLQVSCEPRFKHFMEMNLSGINRLGYNLEIDSLKILQDYKILRVELYKNLKMNRTMNKDYTNYKFSKIPTPLGPLVSAYEYGTDQSIAKDSKPFIMATTMLVQTPMKVAILNQNMSRKVHGYPEEQRINYVVRFETEMSYSDFTWVLPTQNKPKRLRQTRIADFNNIMRGNPFFENKFDLVNDVDRYRYMNRNDNLDRNIRNFIINDKLFI